MTSGLTRVESPAAVRARSAGVILMGFGLAMIILLAFAADSPEVGFGIGGAFALLGAAFFVNGALLSKSAPPPLPDWRSRPASKTNGPAEPPPNSMP